LQMQAFAIVATEGLQSYERKCSASPLIVRVDGKQPESATENPRELIGELTIAVSQHTPLQQTADGAIAFAVAVNREPSLARIFTSYVPFAGVAGNDAIAAQAADFIRYALGGRQFSAATSSFGNRPTQEQARQAAAYLLACGLAHSHLLSHEQLEGLKAYIALAHADGGYAMHCLRYQVISMASEEDFRRHRAEMNRRMEEERQAEQG
jgi:hypothetical protein